MTKDNQSLGNEERESEETSLEFDELFSDITDEDDESKSETITREEFQNLVKGVKNLATEFGRAKKSEKVDKETKESTDKDVQKKEVPPQVANDDVSELFFAQMPQAEMVKDDLQRIANANYGGSILKAWRGEKWLQEKANTLHEEKTLDENNKSKVEAPGSGKREGDTDLKNISQEDIEKMPLRKRVKVLSKLTEQGK